MDLVTQNKIETKGTDVLRAEHLYILKALKILEVLCTRLEKSQSVEIEHLKEVISFIHDYADMYHHSREEEVLLPYLSSVLPGKWNHTEDILDEHILQRAYVGAMSDLLLHSTDFSTKEKSEKFALQARNYIGLLSEHIYKEDSVLLPAADKQLTQAQQMELFHNFQNREMDQNKKLLIKVLCDKIKKLEKFYFTPPPEASVCCGCRGRD